MNYLQHNLSFLSQVKPDKQQFYKEFCEFCDARNIHFKVVEVKRPYSRQCLLLSKGRSRTDIMRNVFTGGFRLNQQQMKDMLYLYDNNKNLQGNIVTWTLNSEHITGLAFDIQLINTTHAELSLIAMKWNIKHPFPHDPPHYSLSEARARVPDMNPIELQAKDFAKTFSTLFGVQKDRFLERIKKHTDLYDLFQRYL